MNQTAYAPGVDRERSSTCIYAVSARRATTCLIDSPTARGSYRMPYKTLLVVRDNADRTRKNPEDSSYLSCYLFMWRWSRGPLPREERGTERLGLGLRLPSRDPGPDPLSCTPPPIGLCPLFMYVNTTKQTLNCQGGWDGQETRKI